MTENKLAILYSTQKSLTEWLEDIKHKDVEAIRDEDNEKRERLKVLKEVIGMPFDEPVQFEGVELRDSSARLKKYIKEHGNELCALRLMGNEPGLPKLRIRGKTVADALVWFKEQEIDAEKYRADYVPHSDSAEWSTIFIVNEQGIQGEIIRGGHYQLTQGFFDHGDPIVFSYDYKNWLLSEDNSEAKEQLKEIVNHLHVTDKAKQSKLKTELNAEFHNDYLLGYFETIKTEAFGLWFIDYSRHLGKMYEGAVIKGNPASSSLVSGQTGSPGKAEGKVVIVDDPETDFPAGSILVCNVTTPNLVPLMQKAAAIVTDQGGILSHAAIVARELKVPCIVGAKNATKLLKNGQSVIVNADAGTVNLV